MLILLLLKLYVDSFLILFGTGPPKVTISPKSPKVAEDLVVSFFCKASGTPTPSIHWERKGKAIGKKRTRYEIKHIPHMSVLRIKPVRSKRDNDVSFTCVADNGLEEVRANVSLFVYPIDDAGIG